MTVAIELPDVPEVSRLGPRYLQEALVAILYNSGKLSEKEACTILGQNRRQFEDLLPKFGFSILSDSDDDIAIELGS